MFNVQNKNIIACIVCGAALVPFLDSCVGTSTADRANELLQQAETFAKEGKYQEALNLLDSLDHAYPAEVDMRRRGMGMRPRMLEQLTNLQLQTADSIAAISAYKLDSLSKNLKMVSNAVENYYVYAAEGAGSSLSPGLHPRVAADGRFYIIAASPKPVGATSLTVLSGGESAATSIVGYDGERNDRSSGTDVITFIEAECDDVGRFIATHRDEPVTVTFNGKSNASLTLSDAQRNAVASLYETALLIRERKKQELEKQRLTRLLDVARSQIARTTLDSIPE